ncbi:MAG: methylated-DNA--[protein]-cysteine S-methyltransferase [Longimicrobiales bacterium]|nr:methylated-DNA--[protein]-cysteine S-methyltransferase [Longimicrobiales bacterium]
MSVTTVYAGHLSGTPVGTLRLWATERGVRRLDFRHGPDIVRADERLSTDPSPPLVEDALAQLVAYFAGECRSFEIPLDLGALTPFQKRVYARLLELGFGKVTTYGAIAEELGAGPGGARAVGQAVGANPVAIVIPCHRVIGSDHTLHGYSGGLERKSFLLRHEGIVVDGDETDSRVHPEELRLDI